MPKKYRESQRDWFGKRGISWHITVAIRKCAEDIQMLTIVHIFEKCTQDSLTVLAIFDDVLKQLKTVLPDLSSVYMKQDNAGCYHSALAMLATHQIAINNGVKLARLDFSDPQGGKGSCDRKAATIKNHMKRYLYSGHDIETANDMKTAMESSGGIPGVRVAVCSPPTDAPLTCKLDGVSFINNIEYSDTGITSWKAYKIGKGKFTRWSDLGLPTSLPTLNKKQHENSETSFVSVKPRKKPKQVSREGDEEESSDDEGDQEGTESDRVESEINDDQKLFFCPEEGCIKSFQQYASLEKHLDCGRHKYSLEYMTLYDNAMALYATKLEQGMSYTTALEQTTESPDASESSNTSTTVLPMGWALKTVASKKRFTETKKKYLMDLFTNGEVTGHKADPVEVSRSMRKVKNTDGTRMFDKSQFLTSQQITSFFSRQARSKVLRSNETVDSDKAEADDDQLLDMGDQDVQELANEIINIIGLPHPIVFGPYNICEMSSNDKLTEFSINMLKEVFTALELEIAHITVRRKKTFVQLIKGVVDRCSCSRDDV